MQSYDRLEAAYRRRTYYHKAYYSLDRGDGIEYDALFVSMTPCELYERKVTMEQLHAAIAALPDKQAKRIYARYFLGLDSEAIAKSENISVSAVNSSIQRGLRNLEKFLKKRIVKLLHEQTNFSWLLEGHAILVTSGTLKTEYTVLQVRNPRE